MSKTRTRVIVALLALTFSLVSTGVVTEARDGMPPVKRRVRRNNGGSHHQQRHVVEQPPLPFQPKPKKENIITRIPGKIKDFLLGDGKPPKDRSGEDY